MQSLHLVCNVKCPSICKFSIYMQSQSLCLIFKLSTTCFLAVKSLPSSKTYINLTYHLYIITLVNITHPALDSLCHLQVLLTLQDLLSVSSSLPFVHTTHHYLLDNLPIIFSFILYVWHLIKKKMFDLIFEYTMSYLCSSLVPDSGMSLSNAKKQNEHDWPSLSICCAV